MKRFLAFILIAAMAGTAIAGAETVREVIPAKTDGKPVSAEQMKTICEEIKTPYKYGVVLKGEGDRKVDSPSVFRHGDKWYMTYISIDIAHGLAPIDVFIEHNTCWNAGEGWALQGESRPRYSLHIPDQLGYHLNFEILDIP
jgi:hypothetical protein